MTFHGPISAWWEAISAFLATVSRRFRIFTTLSKMLPATAKFHFPWEVKRSQVQDGQSVRTFGRLTHYDPDGSRATLTAQHATKDHHVAINTLFVEPFNPIIGAQFLVLGEVDTAEGTDVVIRARVLNCVDGVNVALLQKAIEEQRSFFRERELKQSGDDAQAADAT